MAFLICLGFQALVLVQAQQVGTYVPNQAPEIIMQKCTRSGGCQDEQYSLVLDSNWRWVHNVEDYGNCAHYDPANCAIEGVEDYSKYGVLTHSSNRSVTLRMQGSGGAGGGSRLFVADGQDYKTFNLINRELSFEVDVSSLECGTNGALYFVSMDPTGGMGGNNMAGAQYGLGYCDAQCPGNKWEEEVQGFCCTEMDIWEANRQATAFTAHPCDASGPCSGNECSGGFCDRKGCDINPYRLGEHSFYGPDMVLDSSKPMTVVTQFLTDDGTDSGNMTEMRRFYLQEGKLISSINSSSSISDEYCQTEKAAFGSADVFQSKGGISTIASAFEEGMVLTLSLWEDLSTEMRWLDSDFPIGGSAPGDARGPCNAQNDTPQYIDAHKASAFTKYSNIQYGEIGSTTAARRLSASFQV